MPKMAMLCILVSKDYSHVMRKPVVNFFSSFFNATVKTKPYLKRGIIAGITRIAKESIFTGINNLKVVTATSDRYATSFGFTEREVFDALDDMGYGSEKEEVKKWYDGFTFGNCTDINNLRSIVSAVWSLLLTTGYPKVLDLKYVGECKRKVYTLAFTNMETESILEFKVLNSDGDKETLEDTMAAHRQIAEKKYEAELVPCGFELEKIRKYGFAFRGKECLIG